MDRVAPRGATVDLSVWHELADRALLFGEAQGRVIVSTAMPDTVLSIARKHNVPARSIGRVGALAAPLQITTASLRFAAPLDRLDTAYHEAIPRIMAQAALSQ